MSSAALVIKEIKPARFKDKAFKAALAKAAKKAGKDIKKDFEATTKTWKHKVKFTVVSALDPNIEVLVGTDDEIYGYVNSGTGLWGPKHSKYPIFAGIYTGKSNKKALAFPASYKAKTRPRVIGSTGGGSSGPIVIRPYVEHPGIKPREFDKVIQKKWVSPFKRRMERAMRDAAKASGHSM